jgi:hypothetical protein
MLIQNIYGAIQIRCKSFQKKENKNYHEFFGPNFLFAELDFIVPQVISFVSRITGYLLN